MQDSQLLPPKEKSPTVRWWRLAKWIVTLLIFGYVYKILQNSESGLSAIASLLGSLFVVENTLSIITLLLLVPLNWALESAKWQLLARKAVRISFGEAFRSTLTGLAVGVAVPAQLGDTLGRITSLRSHARLRTLGAALVSNGIQFYVSILGGAVSWFLWGSSLGLSRKISLAIGTLLAIILMGGIVLGIFRAKLVDWPTKRVWAIRLKKNIAVAGRYSSRELGFALLIGLARYLVFIIQFTLALSLFQLPISGLEMASSAGLIFLVKTLLPAINVIGDLGIRQFTALYVFAPYQLATEKILAATFMIWLINILAPLLIGVYFIWKYKWSAKYV